MNRRGPKRLDERADPARRAKKISSVTGSAGEPGLERRVARHLLQEDRQEEEERRERRVDEQRLDVRER